MGELVAVLNKKGRDVTEKVLKMLQVSALNMPIAYGIATPSTIRIGNTLAALQKTDIEKSHIAIGHIFSKIFPNDKPQPAKLEEASLVFEGRIYPSTRGIADLEIAVRKLFSEFEKAVETFIKYVDGDFALAIASSSGIVAGRDVIGVRPLYYGENANFAALASNRRALWEIGINKAYSFPPGHMALVDENGFKFKPVKVLLYPKQARITTITAIEKLRNLIECSLKARVYGLREVAVAFSGGIDSSLVAFLAKKLGVEVQLIHVSLKNMPETEHAKKVAQELKLPLHVCLFSEEDLERVIPKVVWLVEDINSTNISIGATLYWTAEKGSEMDLKVLLTGQGADELFGGYKRYVDYYLYQGREKTRRKMFTDIADLHKNNIERDFKICNFHGVELRLPFATYKLAQFAASLPVKLKIRQVGDTQRKIVLRQVAKNLGIPPFIVEYPKKAMQYATGIHKSIWKLARKHGTSVKEYLNYVFKKVYRCDQPVAFH
jgi:asparagine synthase (glutamine-hydrolysing)